MPLQSPRKRTFAATSVCDDNENIDRRDFRRQRTGSSSSIETIRPIYSSSKTTKVLSDKVNEQPTTNPTAAQKSGLQIAKPLHTVPKRPTKIPVKSKPKRDPTSSAVKLGPSPPATTVLSEQSPANKPFGVQKDAELGTPNLDSIPSIPSPPASPPKAQHNDIDKKNVVGVIPKPLPNSRLSDSTGTIGIAFPTKHASALFSDRPAPVRVPTKAVTRKPAPQTFLRTNVEMDSKRDASGFVHLSASDSRLFVSFPETPHYEVWDMTEGTAVACPALLFIMARDPKRWGTTALSIPDVTRINIDCRTKPVPSKSSDHRAEHHWSTRYEGAQVPCSDGAPPASQLDSIALENRWERIWHMPTVGKGCQDVLGSVANVNQAPPPRKGPSGAILQNVSSANHTQIPGRGFFMRIWIPVPANLFAKKETCVFEISARVWMVPNLTRNSLSKNLSFPPSPEGEDIYITASTEMTVSHLQKEREMGLPGF